MVLEVLALDDVQQYSPTPNSVAHTYIVVVIVRRFLTNRALLQRSFVCEIVHLSQKINAAEGTINDLEVSTRRCGHSSVWAETLRTLVLKTIIVSVSMSS